MSFHFDRVILLLVAVYVIQFFPLSFGTSAFLKVVFSNKRLPFESPGTASKDVSMYTYVWHIADHFEASYPNGIAKSV